MGGSCSVQKILPLKHSSVPLGERVKYFQHTPFFLMMSDTKLNELASCFPRALKVGPDQPVEVGNDDIFVIATGELKLSTSIPNECTKLESSGYLCRKRPGDIVTKMSTQNDVKRKSSLGTSQKLQAMMAEELTIVACSPTILLGVNQEKLQAFLQRNPLLSSPIKAITDTMIFDNLSKIPFLRDVKESQMSVLAAMCRYEAIDGDMTVFEEGTFGSKLYIILVGEVSVHAGSDPSTPTGKSRKARALRRSLELQSDPHDENNEATCVAKLGRGDYFGETSLLVNIPRTMTAKTKQRSLFLTVDKVDFENFLKVCSVKETVDRMMKNRMIQMLSSLGIPFFVGLPTEKLSSISNSVEIHEVDKGSVIFREGDVGDCFYIIFYGEVSIETTNLIHDNARSQRGDITDGVINDTAEEITACGPSVIDLGHYGPGKYFGEMALISESPRSATVIAREKTVLLSIEKQSFRDLFFSDESVLAEFLLRLLQERAELKHLLAHSKGAAVFRGYLKETLADENLEFWEKCNWFRDSKFESVQELREAAMKVFQVYCDEKAEKQVNISHDLRVSLKDRLDNTNLSLDMFVEAQLEIYKVMERDNYARFKGSPAFKSFFEQLGIVIR
uniref:Cyclic nucleotide-binding domain-containing protein n=1 Tax=Leptocylindrus danicus TaxID=163516 RepID=A0A7S2KVM8_9STRA|mmetsp:Transcript_26864/g.39788  ORF Transcript_26864/g.39788 Transcript_26864/m.39788 type:complete len:618 (+) Transcript_26864:1358-3211(+)